MNNYFEIRNTVEEMTDKERANYYINELIKAANVIEENQKKFEEANKTIESKLDSIRRTLEDM